MYMCVYIYIYIYFFHFSPFIFQDTGPIFHFVNGKSVEGDDAFLSNAIHVHWACIEWYFVGILQYALTGLFLYLSYLQMIFIMACRAPRVFFVGETIKNLKTELARSAKLKCSSCGMRGAALGCYKKSCRRSYHAPCAKGVAGCRWDFVSACTYIQFHVFLIILCYGNQKGFEQR